MRLDVFRENFYTKFIRMCIYARKILYFYSLFFFFYGNRENFFLRLPRPIVLDLLEGFRSSPATSVFGHAVNPVLRTKYTPQRCFTLAPPFWKLIKHNHTGYLRQYTFVIANSNFVLWTKITSDIVSILSNSYL